MVKIFPTRFIIENADETELWRWVNEKIKNTKITQIVPMKMECQQDKNLTKLKGLLEIHCTENVSTSEFEKILKPYPAFIQHIFFTFQ